MKILKHQKLSLCSVGALAIALCSPPGLRADYQSSILDQSPLGYWRLNETTVPGVPNTTAANLGSLGAAENGTYLGDQSFYRGAVGAVAGNTAASFDGVSQAVQAPYNASLNPTTWSVEGWLAPATLSPPGGLTCALSCGTFSSPRSGWLIYHAAAGAVGANAGWNLRLYNQNGTSVSLSILAATNMVVGTYYHVAATFDGTTARLYVNGVQLASASPTSYVPGVSGPFSIGSRSDGNTTFPWAGRADEVAYYNTVLSASDVAAHYAAATTNAANYATQILAQNPLVYYRLGEANTDPGAANLGTLGTSGNGVYIAVANAGQAGPRPPTFPLMDPGNNAVSFDGTGGYVGLPALGALGNTAAMTAWVMPNGPQANNAGIFFNSGANSGLRFANTGALQLGYDWNGSAGTYASGLNLPDSQWSFVGLIIQPTQAILCLHDGTTFSRVTNTFANGSVTLAGKSRIGGGLAALNGTVDEVTVFNRSIGVGDVYSQYAASKGGLPPIIFQDPVGPVGTVYQFDPFNIAVDAGGTPALTYQWRKNSGDIGGANNSNYSIPSLGLGDGGTYDVVIANGFGSVTSAPVTISVTPIAAPQITQDPVGRTNYAGGLINLSVTATGGALKYQWQKNGAAVGGATTSAYVVTSAIGSQSGTYTVAVTNALGALTSAPAIVSIIQPASNSFEGLIVTDGPEAWWRLNDPVGSPTALDAMGRHDGSVVGNVTYGAAGIVGNGGNTSASFDGTAGNYIEVPYSPLLNQSQYTLECWVNTPDLGVAYSPISSLSVGSASSPYHGKGYLILSETGGQWRDGGGNDDQYIYYYVDLGPVVASRWTHLVLTFSSANGQVFYYNGTRVPASGGYVDFIRNTVMPLLIGAADPQGHANTAGALNLYYKGQIDEVAYYGKLLTQAQIQAHYQLGLYGTTTAPLFTTLPRTQTVYPGSNVTLTAVAEGTTPIGLQWLKNGSPIAGATSNSLTLNNIYFTDAGNYQLRATNTVGASNSPAAVVSVVPPPSFALVTNNLVLHLKFDGNYLDSSGRGNNGTAAGNGGGAPSIVSGKIGSGALHYFTLTDANGSGGSVTNDGYVDLGTPADFSFGASQDFSIAYWVQLPNGYLGGDLPFFCSAGNSYGNFGITLAPSYNGGGWSWFLGNSTGGVGLYGAGNSINNGAWHHLVHTFARASYGTTYLDGVLVDNTLDLNAGDIDSGNPFVIGQDTTGLYPEQGSGQLDDIGVWRRVLTQAEVQNIYYVGQNLNKSFDTYGPVSITTRQSGGNLDIVWQAGTLLESTSLSGPWTPVVGATAPFFRAPIAASGNKFYKVQL